jgi:hypothetical protein
VSLLAQKAAAATTGGDKAEAARKNGKFGGRPKTEVSRLAKRIRAGYLAAGKEISRQACYQQAKTRLSSCQVVTAGGLFVFADPFPEFAASTPRSVRH